MTKQEPGHPMICVECRKILPPLRDEKIAYELEGVPISCRECMIKRHGEAYIENVENMSEEDLLDALEDDEDED
jgi:hypothetical protein